MTFALAAPYRQQPLPPIDTMQGPWMDYRLNRQRSDPHLSASSSSFEPPTVVFDERSGSVYDVGRMLGKGGFAHCYLATSDRQEFALKLVSRRSMRRRSDVDKIYREINIHQTLRHPNIVAMYTYFEDHDNIYMLLEYCPNRTLLHYIEASPARCIPEPDAIVFLKQLLRAIKYLHEECGLLHRDIKPGNILLSRELTVKLADFGFAVPLREVQAASVHNVCGTPNYVAPEILEKRGPSVYSEYWAVACTFYCTLYGRPPFESECVDTTYERIKRCQYVFPEYCNVSAKSQHFISKILVRSRNQRMGMEAMLSDPVFSPYNRSLSYGSGLNSRVDTARSPTRHHRPTAVSPKGYRPESANRTSALGDSGLGSDVSGNLGKFLRNTLEVYSQTVKRLLDVFGGAHLLPIDCELPPSFVAKWVDYTNKFGFGATLKDGTRTMVLTDHSTLSSSGDSKYFAYRHRRFSDDCMEWQYGQTVGKKVAEKLDLLHSLRDYMDKHLYSFVPIDDWEFRRRLDRGDVDQLTYIVDYWKFPSALLVFLSDGSCQVNFCDSHVKMLMRRGTRGDIKIHVIGADQRIACYLVRSSPSSTAAASDAAAGGGVPDSMLIRLADFRSVVEEYLCFFGKHPPVLYSTDC